MRCAKCDKPFANEGDAIPMIPTNGDPVEHAVCQSCASRINEWLSHR